MLCNSQHGEPITPVTLLLIVLPLEVTSIELNHIWLSVLSNDISLIFSPGSITEYLHPTKLLSGVLPISTSSPVSV